MTWFSLRRENYAHTAAFTGSIRQQKWRFNTMTQSRPDKLAKDLAREWLEKHALKQKPKPKPKPQALERWQTCARQQQQERRASAKPLLKGVE
jgi:hypothetical protein